MFPFPVSRIRFKNHLFRPRKRYSKESSQKTRKTFHMLERNEDNKRQYYPPLLVKVHMCSICANLWLVKKKQQGESLFFGPIADPTTIRSLWLAKKSYFQLTATIFCRKKCVEALPIFFLVFTGVWFLSAWYHVVLSKLCHLDEIRLWPQKPNIKKLKRM